MDTGKEPYVGTESSAICAIRQRRENRPCHSCYGSGAVVQDATYNFETGELIQAIGVCPVCHGAGEISVFRYPKVRRSP